MTTTIIGIDCATNQKKVGLALASFDGLQAHLEKVSTGSLVPDPVQTVARWVKRAPPTLIAMDAPLGWHSDLGRTLRRHQAGGFIQPEPNRLFRRETDRVAKERVGKTPLDVGADRIARTAHSALSLVHELRRRTGEPLPLAWNPVIGAGTHAIEVYPGATFAAYWVDASGYKNKDGQAARRALLAFLGQHMRLPADLTLMVDNDDALDASVCVLAGADFLRGEAVKPSDQALARKEGWIWVRKPVTQAEQE